MSTNIQNVRGSIKEPRKLDEAAPVGGVQHEERAHTGCPDPVERVDRSTGEVLSEHDCASASCSHCEERYHSPAPAFRSAGFDAPRPFQRLASPGRNEPCPCGSGRKFKACCGRPASVVSDLNGRGGAWAPEREAEHSREDFSLSAAPARDVEFADSAREKGHVLLAFAERVLSAGLPWLSAASEPRERERVSAPCPLWNPVAQRKSPRASAPEASCPRGSWRSVNHPRVSGLARDFFEDCYSPDCAFCAERHHDESVPHDCPRARRFSGVWVGCREPGCIACAQSGALVVHERKNEWKKVKECPRPVKLKRKDRRTGEVIEWEKNCGTKGCEFCGPRRKKRVLGHFISLFKKLPALRFVTLSLDPKIRVDLPEAGPARRPASGSADAAKLQPCESGDYLRSIWKNRYLSRLKRRLKKIGASLYYVGSVEHTERGFAHLHCIMSCPLSPDTLKNQWFESGGGVVADVQTFGAEVDSETLAKKVGYALKYAFKGEDEDCLSGEQMNTKSIGYYSAHYRRERERYAIAEKQGETYEIVHAWEAEKSQSESESGSGSEGKAAPVRSASERARVADTSPVSDEMIDPEKAKKYTLRERATLEYRRDVENLFSKERLFAWEARYKTEGPSGGKAGRDPWNACPQPTRDGPPWRPDLHFWTRETLRERWKKMNLGARSRTWIRDLQDGTGVRETYDAESGERTKKAMVRYRRPGGAKAWRLPKSSSEIAEIRAEA